MVENMILWQASFDPAKVDFYFSLKLSGDNMDENHR